MFNRLELSGKFITFEGIEGSGKTTNINFFAQYLTSKGVKVLLTREPGGTEMGESIRNLLLKHYDEIVVPITEVLLLFAARCQHINNVIKPALASGHCVLCDRFTDATYAYQGGGREVSIDNIEILENLVQGTFRPDFTVLFDIPVEVSVERIKQRKQIDRIESEKLVFFEKVRQAYLNRAKAEPSRYTIIDATQSLDVVENVVKEFLIDE